MSRVVRAKVDPSAVSSQLRELTADSADRALSFALTLAADVIDDLVAQLKSSKETP